MTLDPTVLEPSHMLNPGSAPQLQGGTVVNADSRQQADVLINGTHIAAVASEIPVRPSSCSRCC